MVFVLVRNDAAIAEVLLVSHADVVLLHPGMDFTDVKFSCILVHVRVDELSVEPLGLFDFWLLNAVDELRGVKAVASPVLVF